MFSRNSTSRSTIRLLGLAAAAAFMASGCATPKGATLPDITDWERRALVLGGIERFDFSGRIAVNAGSDGFNGKLRWQQDGSAFSATVSGPLGAGAVRIAGDDTHVRITDGDGVTTELPDVERDLKRRYGWTIPVESLRYWALGIPDPRVAAATRFNEAGALSELVQRGWTVTIREYRVSGGGQSMPRRLIAANADTRVTLLIDRWVFFDEADALQPASLTPM